MFNLRFFKINYAFFFFNKIVYVILSMVVRWQQIKNGEYRSTFPTLSGEM